MPLIESGSNAQDGCHYAEKLHHGSRIVIVDRAKSRQFSHIITLRS